MTDAVSTVIALHRVSSPKATLLVDIDRDLAIAFAKEEGFAALARTGKKPEEMWVLAPDTLELVIISAKREPRELYRVLVLAARLVKVGGSIVIMPEVVNEAVEAFVAVCPEMEQDTIASGVVQLFKTDPVREDAYWSRKADESKKGGKRVISLSIFGPDGEHGYWRHLPTVLRSYLTLFPGYEIRIHHDDWVYRAEYGDVLHGLQRRGLVKLVRMAADGISIGATQAMLWRMSPCWDSDVDFVICRDVDSLPTWRDRMAVEEFCQSGLSFGVLHDDLQHVGVLGGLCHVNTKSFLDNVSIASFEEFIANAKRGDEDWKVHGCDQCVLNELIAGSTMTVLEHSLFTVPGEGGVRVARAEPTIPRAVFKTEIALPSKEVIDSVPEVVRVMSDGLTNYLGAAGCHEHEAYEFYEGHGNASVCPVVDEIREAERVSVPNDVDHRGLRQFAVFSSDTNLDYAFYAPIVVRQWTNRGYRSILFLVGTVEQWLTDPRLRLALERSREAGAVIHFVPEVEGVRTSTVAQCVRIFGALAPGVKDEDYLLTSDIDMLPLGPWVGSGRGDDFTIWFANAYEEEVVKTGRPHWPMCYVGAPVRRWRTYFGEERSRFVDMLKDCPTEVSEAWGYDEIWMSERLAEHPEQLTFVPRTFVKGEWRLDRSDWDGSLAKMNGSLDGVADAHLIRPGWGDQWLRIAPLLALALTAEQFEWVNDYHNRWMEAK